MNDEDTPVVDSIDRRRILQGLGCLGTASILFPAFSTSAAAQPVSDGWFDMAAGGDGTYSIEWGAPPTTVPDGLLGEVFVRALDSSGNELVLFEAGFGLDPNGREFRFEGTDRQRLRGVVVVNPTSGGGRELGIALRGDRLTGDNYSLTVTDPGSGEEVSVDFDVFDEGGSTELGPVSTSLPEDEDELRFTVTGDGFDESNGVSDPFPPEEEFEAEPGDPGAATVTNNGVTLEVLDPVVELINGEPEIELVGGDTYPFDVAISGDAGSVATVQWQLVLEGEPQTPNEAPPGETPGEEPIPIEDFVSMDFDAGNERFTIDWTAPATSVPDGLLGSIAFRALTADGSEELVRYDAGFGLDPNGREFLFDGSNGERVRGVVAINPTEGGGTVVGIAIRGDSLTGDRYDLTVTDPASGDVITVGFDVFEERGSAELGPAPTNFPTDEDELVLTVTGEGYDESNGVSGANPPPEEFEEEPVDLTAATAANGDVTLQVLEPPAELINGEREIELVGGDTYTFEVQVTDGDTVLTDADVDVQWQLVIDGEVQPAGVRDVPLPPDVAGDPVEGPPTEEEEPPAEQTNRIVISSQGIDGGSNYRFSVSGTATVGASPAGDSVTTDGTQAFGAVSTFKDSYDYTGDIVDFFADNPAALEITITDENGERTLSGADMIAEFGDGVQPPVDQPADLPNSITISSQGLDGSSTYSFTAEQVAAGPTGDRISEDGASAFGRVSTFRDGYTYSGSITSFSASNPAALRIIITDENGERTLTGEEAVAEFGGSEQPGTEPPASDLPNSVVISSQGLDGSARYRFSVSERVEAGTDPAGDNVTADGTQAFGRVSTFKDGYAYAGDITDFFTDNPAAIEVIFGDGTVLTGEEAIAQFGDGVQPPTDQPADLPNSITISSQGIDGSSTYSFSVSEQVAAGPTGDRISDDGTRAFGRVSTFRDGYTYAGDITSFSAANPSALLITLSDGRELTGQEAIDQLNG